MVEGSHGSRAQGIGNTALGSALSCSSSCIQAGEHGTRLCAVPGSDKEHACPISELQPASECELEDRRCEALTRSHHDAKAETRGGESGVKRTTFAL